MSVKTTVRVEGLKELDAALGELPKATGKNVVRRAMTDALTPMRDVARAKAPRRTGQLSDSIIITGRLSARYKGFAKETGSYIEVYMGPAPGTAKATVNEFGSFKMSPTPYMRPAWDQEAQPTLDRFGKAMWARIEDAAKRMARKAARLAAKGGGR